MEAPRLCLGRCDRANWLRQGGNERFTGLTRSLPKSSLLARGSRTRAIWLWRRANRLKPAADVHFGVPFTAKVTGSSAVCAFQIPSQYGQLGIVALNYEPK